MCLEVIEMKPRLRRGFMIICKSCLNPNFHNIGSMDSYKYDLTAIFILDKDLSFERLLYPFINLLKSDLEPDNCGDLFERITSIGVCYQIFILGDFNAQNEVWGSTKNNDIGEFLCKFLSDSPFYLLKNRNGTRVSVFKNYISAPVYYKLY